MRDVAVPPSSLAPQQTKLANGITLIVQPETISDSVFVYGSVEDGAVAAGAHRSRGASRGSFEGMYPYGTQTM